VSVRFLPIEGSQVAPRVPFEVRLPGDTATGLIRLGNTDPLAIAFKNPPGQGNLVPVWAAALLGFADLTVWPDADLVQPSHDSQRNRSSRTLTRTPRGIRERAAPMLRRRRYVGGNGRSRVDIATIRAHLVVGHKRWLQCGHEPSSEKIAEAAALGMDLAAGQTWVRPHLRAGHTAMRTIRVRWQLPSFLLDLL
jgi:hypothetical protein